jgi:hypothetical protein
LEINIFAWLKNISIFSRYYFSVLFPQL